MLECVNVPNDNVVPVDLQPYHQNGCEITVFHSEPNVYSVGRIRVEAKQGRYERKEFYFLTVISGAGFINDLPVHPGETIFVPCGFGAITLKGALDLTYVTYEVK